MKLFKTLAVAFVTLAASIAPAAHAEWNDSIRYHGEIYANFGGGENNPFWFSANRYGLTSTKKNNGSFRLGAFHDLDHSKRFSWGAGVDLAVAWNQQRVFIPQQIYGEVKYRCLNLLVGKKEFGDEVVTSDLSSGGLTYAGNAQPIPQIRAGIFDYADFWGCKGWFAIKGHIAYGKFTDSTWVKDWVVSHDRHFAINTFYCSRAIYFRGGNADKFPLVGELGLEMGSVFGGDSYFWNGDGYSIQKNPKSWKAWVKALIPMHGGADTGWGEQNNVEGNFLGNWAMSLRWEDPSGWMVKLYYEHFFEDHSMLFFDYPWKDGLYGVEARLPKNPVVSEALFECLYSRDQSGAVYWDHVPALNVQISERDNYYNHYFYNGWQNWGYGIGNPLTISPIYNKDHMMYFKSTRNLCFNVGIKGEPTPQVGYRIKASTIKSWGTYGRPYRDTKHDFSMLAEVSWHPATLRGWEGKLGFGLDRGDLIGNNIGAAITISKTGYLFAPKKK